MAEISKPTCHLRSISLPSKTHPLATSVEERLAKVKASESVCHKLGGLKDLYETVDDLFQLPHIQQALSRDKSVDEMLDGSLRLLDVCNAARDVFLQMKETIQELESSLRRKRTSESTLENEVKSYVTSRKRLNKVLISKCFTNLKRTEKKSDLIVPPIICMLKEVEDVSFTVVQSLLSSFCQPDKRFTKWNVVSKLFQSRRVSCKGNNELDKMDADLVSLIGKKISLEELQIVMKGLENFECSIQEIEEELECVYRLLLKCRVSLLNMLNH
ncbi:uncharacterized protein LOC126676151 [Mercurialis annua]|uniref:uncharacterized protein LOC126676151 n=1 Tax=Mercurialis annua TaxID=3986 RepID=UPI00216063B3|nr:uncharacterized protein LOC126676151 [Mercurialis annua]